jgi:hypothetical protein
MQAPDAAAGTPAADPASQQTQPAREQVQGTHSTPEQQQQQQLMEQTMHQPPDLQQQQQQQQQEPLAQDSSQALPHQPEQQQQSAPAGEPTLLQPAAADSTQQQQQLLTTPAVQPVQTPAPGPPVDSQAAVVAPAGQQQQRTLPPPPVRRLLNLAELSDGASVLAANPEAKRPERAIDKDIDSFMKNDCNAHKWMIIELSQVSCCGAGRLCSSGTPQEVRLTAGCEDKAFTACAVRIHAVPVG